MALACGIGRPGNDAGQRSLAVIGRPENAPPVGASGNGRAPAIAGAVRADERPLPSDPGVKGFTTALPLARQA